MVISVAGIYSPSLGGPMNDSIDTYRKQTVLFMLIQLKHLYDECSLSYLRRNKNGQMTDYPGRMQIVVLRAIHELRAFGLSLFVYHVHPITFYPPSAQLHLKEVTELSLEQLTKQEKSRHLR